MISKDCIHNEVCKYGENRMNGGYCTGENCRHFKNKADFVEVVRCRNCKYWETKMDGFCRASYGLCEINNENQDFCSYGERRDT